MLNRPIFFISELPSSLCVSSMVASWFFKNWNFTEEEFMKSLQWIFLYTFRNIPIFALLILFALFDGLCFCLFLLWKDLLILQDLQKKKEKQRILLLVDLFPKHRELGYDEDGILASCHLSPSSGSDPITSSNVHYQELVSEVEKLTLTQLFKVLYYNAKLTVKIE